MSKVLVAAIAFMLYTPSVSAQSMWKWKRDSHRYFLEKAERSHEDVEWLGYIEADGSHNTKHNHSLNFVRKSDGEAFDIIKSPDLEKVHCASEKRLLVRVEAKRTPKRFAWGNNLIVKRFTVLEELDVEPHQKRSRTSLLHKRRRF